MSYAAVCEKRPNLKSPADMYLEGSDQHRGWFHSSLLASVGTRGRAPYDSVLTHGFVVDGEGRKMSKSFGNVIVPDEVISRYGAEILRLWVAAEDYRDDIRISEEILSRLSEAYRRIRNTCRFLLGNLYDFDPGKDAVSDAQLLEIDRWILLRLQKLIARLREAYAAYEFHVVFHSLHNFCAVDLSSLYLDILKDRLYTAPAFSPERRAAQTALHKILDALVRLMATILSFTAEEVWEHLPGAEKDAPQASTSLSSRRWKPSTSTKNWRRNGIASWKSAGRSPKPWKSPGKKSSSATPWKAAVILHAPPKLQSFLKENESLLKDLFIVSQVNIVDAPPAGAYASKEVEGLNILIRRTEGKKCERCWVYDPKTGENPEYPAACPRCSAALRTIASERKA